ncbi:MAG: hypothetical protein ACI85V_001511, partial [bacterium]
DNDLAPKWIGLRDKTVKVGVPPLILCPFLIVRT